MRPSPLSTPTDVCTPIKSAHQEILAHGGIPIGVLYAEGVDWETLAIEFAPAAYWAAQTPYDRATTDRLMDDRLHHLETLPPDAVLLGFVGLHPRDQLVATYIGIALDLLHLTPHELDQHVIQHYRAFWTDLIAQLTAAPRALEPLPTTPTAVAALPAMSG